MRLYVECISRDHIVMYTHIPSHREKRHLEERFTRLRGGWEKVGHKILRGRKYKNNKGKEVKDYGRDCGRVGGGSGLVENMTTDRDGDCYLIAKAPALSSVPLQVTLTFIILCSAVL